MKLYDNNLIDLRDRQNYGLTIIGDNYGMSWRSPSLLDYDMSLEYVFLGNYLGPTKSPNHFYTYFSGLGAFEKSILNSTAPNTLLQNTRRWLSSSTILGLKELPDKLIVRLKDKDVYLFGEPPAEIPKYSIITGGEPHEYMPGDYIEPKFPIFLNGGLLEKDLPYPRTVNSVSFYFDKKGKCRMEFCSIFPSIMEFSALVRYSGWDPDFTVPEEF